MIEVLCECSWGIPGVEKLPPHLHRSFARVEIRGQVVRVEGSVVALNPGMTVVEGPWEEIDVTVDWKALAHAG